MKTEITVQKGRDSDVEHHTQCSLTGCTVRSRRDAILAWKDERTEPMS